MNSLEGDDETGRPDSGATWCSAPRRLAEGSQSDPAEK